MIYPSVIIKKDKEFSIERKHPWVFSGAIHKIPKSIIDGGIVYVANSANEIISTGYYQEGGSISIRILAFEKTTIDDSFWQSKIRTSVAYRKAIGLPLIGFTTAYRLFHGEGDNIPGLVIDIYNNIAVIQCHTKGIELLVDNIANNLSIVLKDQIDTIYIRNKESANDNDGDTSNKNHRFYIGSQSETVIVENGVACKVNVITGQKTGFFLDQRDNRLLLGSLSKDKSVLNCFCYTGGFSAYALKNGASKVTSVDISEKAINLCNENVALNGNYPNHEAVVANVLQYLQNKDLPKYDIVIVDPPAFAKSIHKRHTAVQAYKRLNTLAIQKVKSCGLLFTYSCSQVVGTQLFYDTIASAGMESGRQLKVVKSMSQAADHPVNLFHPEGHYLKGLVLHIQD